MVGLFCARKTVSENQDFDGLSAPQLPRSLPDLASVSSRPSAGDQFWSSVQSQGLAGPGPNQMISPQGGKPWATRASRRASAHPPDAHAVLMEGSQPAATFPNRLGVAATASGAQMHGDNKTLRRVVSRGKCGALPWFFGDAHGLSKGQRLGTV